MRKDPVCFSVRMKGVSGGHGFTMKNIAAKLYKEIGKIF